MAIIPPIPDSMEMFRAALVRSQRKAGQTSGKSRLSTIRMKELVRVESLGTVLSAKLKGIVKSTAGFERLAPFQREMCLALIDVDEVRKSLSSIGWAGGKIKKLSEEARRKIRNTREISEMTAARKQFDARTESIMKQVAKDFKVLSRAGKEIKKIPSVRNSPTVVIAGYPNVGKSSILNALSDSTVKVMPYPFTTKQIFIGYAKRRYKEVQLIDTPGILDRPMGKMNRIEQQAMMAVKHLGRAVLFILDPSESCGFQLEKQLQLMETVKRDFCPNVVVVANKKDLATKEQLKGLEYDYLVSANDEKDMEMLKNEIFTLVGHTL